MSSKFTSRTFAAISGEHGEEIDATITLTACDIEGISLDIDSPTGQVNVSLDIQELLRISQYGMEIFKQQTQD